MGLMNGIKPDNGNGKTGGGGWVDRPLERSSAQGAPLMLTAYGGGPCEKNSRKFWLANEGAQNTAINNLSKLQKSIMTISIVSASIMSTQGFLCVCS